MVEPVALGQRAREPVLRQRATVEQHPLGHRAGSTRGLDRALDPLAGDQPQIDDHVRQKARRGAPARGRGDARPLLDRRVSWASIVRSTSAVRIELDGSSIASSAAPIDLDHMLLGRAVLFGVDAEDRVQVRARSLRPRSSRQRPLGLGVVATPLCSASARAAARRVAGGAAHDIARRLAAGPQLEAERPLRDEDLRARRRCPRRAPARRRAAGWDRSDRRSRRHRGTHRLDRTSARVG